MALLLTFFTLVNLVAFLTMWVDKRRAKKNNKERISEGMLFFLATMFGSIGVYLGMFAFRHKTHKWYFIVGIPMLILENCATLYVLYLYL
ncbi:MAG: hypothetical protein AUK58_01980 [Candidatus Moranbacteria bacterium CG2_30_41_165]|nr:MAG: hypothetical protein AUK58_01980 [Candidatus Moranbacteria bacterium CG2_30_41_165]